MRRQTSSREERRRSAQTNRMGREELRRVHEEEGMKEFVVLRDSGFEEWSVGEKRSKTELSYSLKKRTRSCH
jgi:hypothetical protein